MLWNQAEKTQMHISLKTQLSSLKTVSDEASVDLNIYVSLDLYLRFWVHIIPEYVSWECQYSLNSEFQPLNLVSNIF